MRKELKKLIARVLSYCVLWLSVVLAELRHQ